MSTETTDVAIADRAKALARRYNTAALAKGANEAWRHGLYPSPASERFHEALDAALADLIAFARHDAAQLRRLVGGVRGDDDPPRAEWQELCLHAAVRCEAGNKWAAMSLDERADDAADRALVETAGIIPTSEEHWARFDSAALLAAIPRLTAMKDDIVRRFTTPSEDGMETPEVPLWRLDEDDARAFLFKMANSRVRLAQ